MSLWLAATLILLPSLASAANGAFVTYLVNAHIVSLVIVSILIFGLKYFAGRRIRFMFIYFGLAVGLYFVPTDNLRIVIYGTTGGPIAIILICYAFIRRKEKQKEKQRDSDRGYPTPDL